MPPILSCAGPSIRDGYRDNAVTDPTPELGPTEGRITRLKMLKRSMYRRAEVELFRPRVFPL
jgi:transposase